jgi:hypothetical protein
MRMISSVPSRFCEIASERIASSETTPPALDHVGVPLGQPEDPVGVEAGVHAGEHGDALAGGQGQVALVEALGVGVRALQPLFGGRHSGPPSWCMALPTRCSQRELAHDDPRLRCLR